jgi:xanthine dehydrogenase YagR molybdenum-binding subunit
MTQALGGSISRKDGRLKVTGRAPYAADHPVNGVAHAVAVQSTIARGRIAAIDTAIAEQAPGVLAILHYGNAPRLNRPENNFMSASKPGEDRVVFEDERVHYAGQYVALVVAETLEQARFAAGLVEITYAAEPPLVDTEAAMATAYPPDQFFGEKLTSRRGNPDRALADAAVTVEATYTTPTEHHNPIEPSASIAEWHGDELTLY